MSVETKWDNLRQKNSPCDIFTRFDHYFQLNLGENYFLRYEGELKVIRRKYKPCHEKHCSDSRFSVTLLQVGSAAGVNGPVIFL